MNRESSDPNEIDPLDAQAEDERLEQAESQAEAAEVEPFLADLQADVTQIYLNEIGQNALLTPDEERRLSRLMKQGDFESRQRMIECNLRLVVNIAKHYVNRGMALLDLIEEGNLGLIHALEKFDPERGFRFSTYATWWIRQNIERAIMNQSRTIRLPVHIIKELNIYLRAQRHLESHGTPDATVEDIAHLVDCEVEEVRYIMGLNERTASLDAPLDIDPNLSIGEAIPDEQGALPETVLQRAEVEKYVHEWLNQLTAKQRSVIERRFGINGHDISTLEQVAEAHGITRERVRQIQMEALQSLRKILRRNGVSKDVLF
ncbi:MAG: RNA polymerase sigma factor RpoS [Betaproteobacteria bacterium RBG_16_58_11]|nr:MAG: RNA polymerase sigma factor RpoS [Betaproteobacteria bacterium RBG_16_58_11]